MNRGDAAAATWIFRGRVDVATGRAEESGQHRDSVPVATAGERTTREHANAARIIEPAATFGRKRYGDDQNMRRNVKVLKMLGHELFPWARRTIWIDAKLRFGAEPRAYSRPRRNLPSRRNPVLTVAASAEYPRRGRGAAAKRKTST